MMKGGHGPTNQLQYLNWGAFDHASHAPHLRSCNYYLDMYNIVWCVTYADSTMIQQCRYPRGTTQSQKWPVGTGTATSDDPSSHSYLRCLLTLYQLRQGVCTSNAIASVSLCVHAIMLLSLVNDLGSVRTCRVVKLKNIKHYLYRFKLVQVHKLVFYTAVIFEMARQGT